ncbi:MAG: RNA polymerase sigma factor [Acidobacteriota bacterium]
MEATKTGALTEAGLEAAVQGEAPEVSELVRRARLGDPHAFDDLMRLYERRIIAIGMQMGLSREDALDACQNAFTKAFRYIARFRTGRCFFKWLYRIAVNAIYDQIRWRRDPGLGSLEDLDGDRSDFLRQRGASLEETVESADLARKLLSHLGCLSRQERIVFVLRDLQEMSTRDIGRILRLSQVTVRRHCLSARRKLKERLFSPAP